MSIKNLLNSRFQTAMQQLEIPSECSPLLNQSNKPEFGDYQANGAMGAAKKLKTNPRELAQKILEQVDLEGIASKTEIAGPGFINITICNDFLANALTEPANQPTSNPQTVVIDYSGPNLAKEMHVGHLRSTIIGDAIARILEYQGQKVIRQNHMGDWGTQFGMLIGELELQLSQGEQAELALGDLEIFYQQSKKHFDADPAFADKARANVVKLQSGDKDCLKLWEQFISCFYRTQYRDL
jgi:arginyl-tRNA synthetase